MAYRFFGKCSLPIFMVIGFACSSAHAAEPSSDDLLDLPLETLLQVKITTGTRTPKAVDKIAGAITVISRAEIEHTLAITEDVTAVLAQNVPGYAESTQAMSNTGENLRGRIALRMFDGIPQGSPLREGTRNATFTDMGVIDSIEVINGASASEGMGAAGGMINYLSKSPTKQGDELTLTSRYMTVGHADSSGWKLGSIFTRKNDNNELLVAASRLDRGIAYDGNGRRIGMNPSGSTADSIADHFFMKGQWNLSGSERIQFSASKFTITGKGDYIWVAGDRATGTPDTSELGIPLDAKTEFNDFQQFVFGYRNDKLLGGALVIDAYIADQAMRYVAEDGSDRQDPLIAPLNTLVDQSEIDSNKKGLRTSWTRPDIFSVEGLELRTGIDLTQDRAQQRLALTDRLWVPPMTYRSVAPYAQVTYNMGPVTLSGGYRYEDGTLSVDSYTTTYFRNRVSVEGGKLDYLTQLPNFGAILRLPMGWSMFATASQGFTLPNVGIPLRNVDTPGKKLSDFKDIQAIIADNTEVGFNWRGPMGSFSASTYRSKSTFGASLSIDPITHDFVMNRAPVEIDGYEMTGALKLSDTFKVHALFSHTAGKTTFIAGGPLDKQMGVSDINPDKLHASVTWAAMAQTKLRLGVTKLFSRELNMGTSSEEKTRGYALVDLSGSYEFDRHGKMTLGIENLTNKFYFLSASQVVGFKNYLAGRGRTISASYEVKF